MNITLTRTSDNATLYSQLFEDSKQLNHAIALGMGSSKGSNFTLVVENNGNSLPFNLESIEVDTLIRRMNGIVVRAPKSKEEKTERSQEPGPVPGDPSSAS